jgi:hypothetical protein
LVAVISLPILPETRKHDQVSQDNEAWPRMASKRAAAAAAVAHAAESGAPFLGCVVRSQINSRSKVVKGSAAPGVGADGVRRAAARLRSREGAAWCGSIVGADGEQR